MLEVPARHHATKRFSERIEPSKWVQLDEAIWGPREILLALRLKPELMAYSRHLPCALSR